MFKDCSVLVSYLTEERKMAGIRMVVIDISLNITEEGVRFFSQLVLLSTEHRAR